MLGVLCLAAPGFGRRGRGFFGSGFFGCGFFDCNGLGRNSRGFAAAGVIASGFGPLGSSRTSSDLPGPAEGPTTAGGRSPRNAPAANTPAATTSEANPAIRAVIQPIIDRSPVRTIPGKGMEIQIIASEPNRKRPRQTGGLMGHGRQTVLGFQTCGYPPADSDNRLSEPKRKALLPGRTRYGARILPVDVATSLCAGAAMTPSSRPPAKAVLALAVFRFKDRFAT